MKKKVMVLVVLFLLVFQGFAHAGGTNGEIVFRDALYGAAIGGIIGTAIYLIDQDDFGAKFGMGVAIGTFGGLFFGVSETKSLVEVKDDSVKLALPSPVIRKSGSTTLYSASLLRVDF